MCVYAPARQREEQLGDHLEVQENATPGAAVPSMAAARRAEGESKQTLC